MYNVHFAGMKIGTIHLTESALKLPQELVIPNGQIQLMNSIGQGEPSYMDYVPCAMPQVSIYGAHVCCYSAS